MDSLDQINTTPATSTDAPQDAYDASATDANDDTPLEDIVEEVAEVSRKVNWWKVAGYAALGVAAAGAVGGYVYLKAQEKKPKTRLGRLRGQLGLEPVDFSGLPSSLRNIDFNRLKKTSRQVGTYAKKKTHAGAVKVAELTR